MLPRVPADTPFDLVAMLFNEARRLDPGEREAFLRKRCPDASLRSEVEGLLRAHDLEEKETARTPSWVGAAAFAWDDDPSAAPGQLPPVEVQGFRLLRRIASGGMGSVYEAEQEHPRRRVAVKMLRPEAATPQGLRRFALEAEALARLRHPGIAQIHLVGTARTPAGEQPFLAMELVDGARLTDFARALDLPARIELLAKTADAVEHAHQGGVIHRDLKPGNILVTPDGQPKVLDFGIAQLADAGQTVHTRTGQVLGTLAYMSPEQLEGDATRLDARSDVFALGVIAYEVLCGRLPHEIEDLPLPAAVGRLLDEDPPPPQSVDRRLKGDLAAILMTALAREPGRRYQSAGALADDLRRFLRDEAVHARAPTAAYQLRKFVRRRRALVGGIAGAMAALAAGLVLARERTWRVPRPDLEVTAFESPGAVRVGTPVRLSATVRNIGERPAPATTAAFHLVRTVGVPPGSEASLGVVPVPALEVNQSKRLTLDVTIASVPHGGDAAWMVRLEPGSIPERTMANNVQWTWAGTLVTPSVTWQQTYKGPPASQFGSAVCGVGDVDGDGFDDVIVGAPKDGSAAPDAGLARVLSGPTGLTIWDFAGSEEGDQQGWSVGAAGDADGDGVPDLIVGAPLASGGGTRRGRVQLFSGRTGRLIRAHQGASDDARLGTAVAGVGDVDGDGYDDSAIAAREGQGPGSVAVWSGRTGARVFVYRESQPSGELGVSLAPAGDVDGDGAPDLIAGAPGEDGSRGAAHVISGRNGRLLRRLVGATDSGDFGRAVARAGDLDRDGVPDLAVGAPGTRGGPATGAVRVFSGRTFQELAAIPEWTPGEQFGGSLSEAGDLDGDGVPDLVVGAPCASPGASELGRADVISGRTLARLYSCQGWSALSRFGTAAALVRDVNDDGRADLFVGAPFVSGLQILLSSEKSIGRSTIFGRPGATSGGSLPRIGVAGSPQLGRTISLSLRSAPPATAALLLLGFVRTDEDLGSGGAPGSRLYTLPIRVLPLATDAGGRASLPMALPDEPGLLDVQAFAQWAVPDPRAHALVASDAVRIVIGGP
jgi:hypothetical protein